MKLRYQASVLVLLTAWAPAFAVAKSSLDVALKRAEQFQEQERFADVLQTLSPYAESGDPRVSFLRAHALWIEASEGRRPNEVESEQLAEARRIAEQCAALEYGGCLNLLYLMHTFDASIPADREKALGFLRRAINAGDNGAKLNYAIMLYTGADMVGQDVDAACRHFVELMHTPANAIAAYYLGLATFRGQCGLKADANSAMKLILKAAEHGVVEAQRDVGKNYQFGWATKPDEKRALRWYEKAAEQGDGESLWRLGMAHVTGDAGKQDSSRAADYFRRAASAGYAEGMVSLAVMYATGDGVPRDYEEALRLYEEAAEIGEPHAFFGLAVMHARGEAVPVNLVKARALYAQAVNLGDEPNDAFLRHLEANMSEEELAEAEELFATWKLERSNAY